MKQRKPHEFAESSFKIFQRLVPSLYVLATLAIAANIYYFLLNDGLASLSYADKLLPKMLIHDLKLVIDTDNTLCDVFRCCFAIEYIHLQHFT